MAKKSWCPIRVGALVVSPTSHPVHAAPKHKRMAAKTRTRWLMSTGRNGVLAPRSHLEELRIDSSVTNSVDQGICSLAVSHRTTSGGFLGFHQHPDAVPGSLKRFQLRPQLVERQPRLSAHRDGSAELFIVETVGIGDRSDLRASIEKGDQKARIQAHDDHRTVELARLPVVVSELTADCGWETQGAAVRIEGTGFAVVVGEDHRVGSLVSRQSTIDSGNLRDQVVPANGVGKILPDSWQRRACHGGFGQKGQGKREQDQRLGHQRNGCRQAKPLSATPCPHLETARTGRQQQWVEWPDVVTLTDKQVDHEWHESCDPEQAPAGSGQQPVQAPEPKWNGERTDQC